MRSHGSTYEDIKICFLIYRADAKVYRGVKTPLILHGHDLRGRNVSEDRVYCDSVPPDRTHLAR